MSERFRVARDGDLPEIARLVGHSFPGAGRSPEEWERILGEGPHGGGETLWVGEEEGELVAACQLLRFQQWIGGRSLPVMGLGAVAISPARRRRGLAGRLVAEGLRHARDRGDVGTALYPFRISFYQKLGYGLAGEALQYRLPPESFPDAPERAGVQLARTEADLAEVRGVYDAWAPTQTGQMARPERAWEKVWGEGQQLVVLYRGAEGRAEGYVIARYRTDLPPSDRYLEIDERVWLTPEARRGIYAWLGSLGDQWRHVLYRAHPEEGFSERVREPRLPTGAAPGWQLWFPSAVRLHGPMFRLLDLPAAWRERCIPEDVRLTLRLQVVDEDVQENRGSWRLRLEDGRVLVDRSGDAEGEIRTGIETLSRLFIGALSPSEAIAAELAQIDRTELLPRLDRALYLPRPWTFERF